MVGDFLTIDLKHPDAAAADAAHAVEGERFRSEAIVFESNSTVCLPGVRHQHLPADAFQVDEIPEETFALSR